MIFPPRDEGKTGEGKGKKREKTRRIGRKMRGKKIENSKYYLYLCGKKLLMTH